MNIWSHDIGHWRSLEISWQLFFVVLKLWVFILLFRLIPPLGLLVLFTGFYPKLDGCNMAECFPTANGISCFGIVLYQRCYFWICNFIILKAEGLAFASLQSLGMLIEVYKLDSVS